MEVRGRGVLMAYWKGYCFDMSVACIGGAFSMIPACLPIAYLLEGGVTLLIEMREVSGKCISL